MIFHENRLLADDSPYFCRKLGKTSQNLSSAAVVVGALRVKMYHSNSNRYSMKLSGQIYLSRQGLCHILPI